MDQVDTLVKACEGVHTVLHLAGQPSANARWDSLLKDNIEGYIFSHDRYLIHTKKFLLIDYTIYLHLQKKQVYNELFLQVQFMLYLVILKIHKLKLLIQLIQEIFMVKTSQFFFLVF